MLGIATDAIGKRTHLPRVTLLLLFGILIGTHGLNIIPTVFIDNYAIIADIALVMIGFLVGGKLTINLIQKEGREVIIIAAFAVVLTTIVVTSGLLLLGVPPEIAIVLGCISSATAPAATLDVVMESDYRSQFVDRLIAIVALDDLLGLLLFSLALAILTNTGGAADYDSSVLITSVIEIGGAILLGIVIGLPAAFLTGKAKPGQPLFAEAVGLILICGGMAKWLGVSHLISAIVMGAVVTNYAKHHEYAFHEIKNIEWSFMVLFFTLAGASMHIVSLQEISLLLISYILLRTIGKLVGGNMGCRIVATDELTRKWLGSALLPQAGVAIGMALVASSYFEDDKAILLGVVIGATIIFEIFGPIFTRNAIHKVNT